MIHDISIVIPVKSEEEIPYLKVLLEELCCQTDRYRIEIILPIAEGFNKVRDVCYRLKDKFEYIPPISQTENVKGIIEARNFGSSRAEGDILVHLDCDNILDNNFAINHLVSPIVAEEVVMTYTPISYDKEQAKSPKEIKLIKYNNFLLRFEFVPRIPFVIWKQIYQEIGGLEEKNTMMKFCGKVLWHYPGGIKKVDVGTMVSPRHILAKALTTTKEIRVNLTKPKTKPSKSSSPL